MPKITIEGDQPSIDSLRQLFQYHPTLTVISERSAAETPPTEEQGGVQIVAPPTARNTEQPPEEVALVLPPWCVLPSSPRVVGLPRSVLVDEHLEMYTDGSCKPNPGPNGMGLVVQLPGAGGMLEGYGWGEAVSTGTNNKAELGAVLSALNFALSRASGRVTIHTDSDYIVNNIQRFEKRAAFNGLGTVVNGELWQAVIDAKKTLELAGGQVELKWLQGHHGDPSNQKADRLAVKGRTRQKLVHQVWNATEGGKRSG